MISNKRKVAELLLRSGADPNVSRSHCGSTPLHLISMQGYHGYGPDLAEILFEISNKNHRSVNVDALNRSGQTPLHLALSTGSKQVVKSLLKNGADPMLADAQGMTPLHIICNRG
uniref:Ankyrin repeat protein n=1 Tax=Trichogramma kaykai TaxID=54128 RepID=A0ABD2XKN0_9HYME